MDQTDCLCGSLVSTRHRGVCVIQVWMPANDNMTFQMKDTKFWLHDFLSMFWLSLQLDHNKYCIIYIRYNTWSLTSCTKIFSGVSCSTIPHYKKNLCLLFMTPRNWNGHMVLMEKPYLDHVQAIYHQVCQNTPHLGTNSTTKKPCMLVGIMTRSQHKVIRNRKY